MSVPVVDPTFARDVALTRLLALPRELEAAEVALLETQAELARAKAALETAEAGILVREALPGKNEAERKAHLAVLTRLQREDVAAAQESVSGAAVRVRCLQAELGALRAVARLLGGGE